MALDAATVRTLLQEERERLSAAVASVRHDLAEERLGAADELSDYDRHPPDTGTEVNDLSRDLGQRGNFELLIGENHLRVLPRGPHGGRRVSALIRAAATSSASAIPGGLPGDVDDPGLPSEVPEGDLVDPGTPSSPPAREPADGSTTRGEPGSTGGSPEESRPTGTRRPLDS